MFQLAALCVVEQSAQHHSNVQEEPCAATWEQHSVSSCLLHVTVSSCLLHVTDGPAAAYTVMHEGVGPSQPPLGVALGLGCATLHC